MEYNHKTKKFPSNFVYLKYSFIRNIDPFLVTLEQYWNTVFVSVNIYRQFIIINTYHMYYYLLMH